MCQPPVAAAWAKPETMTPAMAAMHAGKEHPGQARDGAEIAIEQRGDQQAGGRRGEVGVVQRGQGGEWARRRGRGQN